MIADGTAYNARSMFFGAKRVNVMNDEAGVFLAVSGAAPGRLPSPGWAGLA
jgi:hypothetical protein